MSDTEDDFGWNAELESEVAAEDIGSVKVYSRDWTVETIVSQIKGGNIDLNPKFQRRNAWNDKKRSRLIESLIIGIPVPEIVLAEDKDRSKAFIIIDGKQRLMAIAGYVSPDDYESWDHPKLVDLNTRGDLNGKTFSQLDTEKLLADEKRELMNADVRCTVITGYKSVQTLYDIFYRLNTGSVPLSSQELRQVLNRGPFANYLIETTGKSIPLHTVLNLREPDARLRDAEILLRYIAFSIYGSDYTGNLTPFLDAKMAETNKAWASLNGTIQKTTAEFNEATQTLLDVMPDKKVGRKFTSKGWETRFNRALYEVQVYYVARVPQALMLQNGNAFISGIEALCLTSPEFVDSIETSTKTIARYHTRFSLFQEMVNKAFGLNIDAIPVSPRE